MFSTKVNVLLKYTPFTFCERTKKDIGYCLASSGIDDKLSSSHTIKVPLEVSIACDRNQKSITGQNSWDTKLSR